MDFGAILAATKAEGPSVIQIRTQDTMPRAIGPKVMNVINTYQASLEKGALIIMDEIKARIRILPLD